MISTGHSSSVATGRLAEVFSTYQGEGPYVGRRHLFVRLAGCTIGCRFCDTPDALRAGAAYEVRSADGACRVGENPVEADAAGALIEDALRASGPYHAVSITGGEPLEQVEFLGALLPRIVAAPVLLETAGTLPDALAGVIDHVAIVSMDVKLPSVARTRPCFAEHRRFLEIARRRDVYVKVVVDAGVDRDEWRAAARLVADVAPQTPFIVQPRTGRDGRLRASFELLDELARAALAVGLSDVRVLPQVHKFLEAP